MSGTDIAAGAVLGAVVGHVVEDVLPDLAGDAPYDPNQHHSALQTQLLASIAKNLQEGRDAAAREATQTELHTLSSTLTYELSTRGKRTSIFSNVSFPLQIVSALGTAEYQLEPGWNALDAPEESLLSVGPGGPTIANVLIRWAPVSLDVDYGRAGGATSGGGGGGSAPDYTNYFTQMVSDLNTMTGDEGNLATILTAINTTNTDLTTLIADAVARNTSLGNILTAINTSNTNLANLLAGLQSATHAVVVTPSDTVNLTNTSRQLFIATAGALSVQMADGTTCVFPGVPDGTFLNVQVTRVNATGTDAANIVSLS